MHTVFVFDEKESRREEDLAQALKGLADDALLWVALRDPTEEEAAAVQEALELSDEQAQRLLEQPSQASLVDAGEHMHVTLYVASSEEGEPVLRSLECVLGRNWVVTAHEAEFEVLEEFRERAEGGGQVGALDSPSFVAAAVEWTVLAGIMGMNFQLGLFDLVWMFWAVIAAMLGIAVVVLTLARTRRWI
jgi:Mg2+ and Co2+ transporter CorA